MAEQSKPSGKASGERDVRESILRAADRLFYRQGIQATGVDAVALEAGVSKRTLYRYFDSKDKLVCAYLERRAMQHADEPGEPLAQIVAVFDWMERWFSHAKFRGCPFINAACELSADPHSPAVKAAADLKANRVRWFASRLRALGADEPDQLAEQLQILVDGAIALSVVRHGDPGLARSARSAAMTLLAAAGVSIADRHPAREFV